MKKVLLLFFLSTCSVALFAQSMLVNRYFNSAAADGLGDVVELVVVEDHLDIRKWFIKDYGNGTYATLSGRLDEGGGKFRFNDIPFWKDLRAGTVIVLRKRTATSGGLATFTPTYAPDIDASDFIIDIDLNDINYMTDIYPDKAFNVTPHEMVLIRADVGNVPAKVAAPDAARLAFLNGANKAVHALAYGDFQGVTTFNGVKSPKAIFSNGTALSDYVGNGSIGTVSLTNPNQSTYTTPISAAGALITLPVYWEKQTALMTGMPYGIEIYKSTTDYSLNAGPVRKMKAYAVVVDPKYVDFKPTSALAKTPQQFVTDEPGTVLACINGGFFGGGASYSMIKYNGSNPASNIASVSRSVYSSTANNYYPTRAAFGISPSLQPDATWVYTISGQTYSYTAPAPNDVNLAPQPVPIASAGVVWNAVSAIGGSPMLIKNGVINITSDEELIEIDNTSPRARTAIGYNANGKIILLTIEGGNPGVSSGFTLAELAQYMKDMGCVGAINLDGGGSTVLRINNQEMVKPSDVGGVERAMPGVVLIKSKN